MTILRTVFLGSALTLSFSAIECGRPSCDADGHAELTPFATPTVVCDNGATCRVDVHATKGPMEVVCNANDVKGATCSVGGPYCFASQEIQNPSQFTWTGVSQPVKVGEQPNSQFGTGCCVNLVVKFN